MRLRGTIAERLGVLTRESAKLLGATDVADLEDEGVALRCRLDGPRACIRLRLPERGIKMLRGQKCADYALLLERGEDVFEAHVLELTKVVSRKKWETVREQLEWATLHVLAAAGILGVRIQGVVFYTVHHSDELSREGSTNPAAMKIPVSPHSEADVVSLGRGATVVGARAGQQRDLRIGRRALADPCGRRRQHGSHVSAAAVRT